MPQPNSRGARSRRTRRAWASFTVMVALLVTVTVAHADTAQLETGEKVYGDYCASCHGDELRNTSGGVTFDLRRLRASDHERYLDAVLNGKRQMPPWRGALQMEQIEAIWAYIRAKVDH
jgi:mono/diheme cytochrome c family protein